MRTLEEIVGHKLKSYDFWERSSLYFRNSPTIIWEASPDLITKIGVSVAFVFVTHPVITVTWTPIVKSLASYTFTRLTLPAIPPNILKYIYELVVPQNSTTSKVVTVALVVTVVIAAVFPLRAPPSLPWFSGAYLCIKNKLTETFNYARKISTNLIK